MVTRLPFNGYFRISQTYNNINPALYGSKHHTGVDMVGITSIKVYGTMEAGEVVYKGYQEYGFGNYIKVKDNSTGNYHYYAHLKEIYVSKGDKVTYTTVLGLMGATGFVTGAHLHYEIRRPDNKTRLDPCEYMGIPNKTGEYHALNYVIKSEAEIREEQEELKALEKCDELEKRLDQLIEENKKLKEEINNIDIREYPYFWEEEALEYCVIQGIIKGDGEKIDLNEAVSMGKLLVIVYRVIMHIKKWFVKKADCKCQIK